MKKSFAIDAIFMLVLFGVFAVSVLMTLGSGAQAYRGIAASLENHYEERTCVSYIATKVRHNDRGGNISITEFGDGSALAIQETIAEDEYCTLIYSWQGQVMELFTALPLELGPDAGLPIIGAKAVDFSTAKDGLLKIHCTGSSDKVSTLFLSLRSQGGGQ